MRFEPGLSELQQFTLYLTRITPYFHSLSDYGMQIITLHALSASALSSAPRANNHISEYVSLLSSDIQLTKT